VSQEDAEKVAKEMLPLVGLSDEVLEKSPFELSGGQMRRVAIAGVLAMQPEVLVLDEPTAGLDPKGRRDMMQMFKRLHTEQGMTIVLVTHLMDDVTDFADYVYVLEKGTIVKGGTPKEVFADTEWLAEKQLGVPLAAEFAEKLEAKGIHFDEVPMTVAEMADVLAARLNSKVGDAK
jgi:energy-coupling factor transport system ATP-binding protein